MQEVLKEIADILGRYSIPDENGFYQKVVASIVSGGADTKEVLKEMAVEDDIEAIIPEINANALTKRFLSNSSTGSYSLVRNSPLFNIS